MTNRLEQAIACDDADRDAPIEQLEGGTASEEPRCALCDGRDAKGYRIDEQGFDLAFVAVVRC